LIILSLVATSVFGDVYMHNPGGSNDRNRERNENRANANRLFDSQNNAKGGYAWRGDRELMNGPDPMEYVEGSKLRLEWTQQHGCGDNPTTHCTIVWQYACDDTLSEVYCDATNADCSYVTQARKAATASYLTPRDGYPGGATAGGRATLANGIKATGGDLEDADDNDNSSPAYQKAQFNNNNGGGNQNEQGTNRIPYNDNDANNNGGLASELDTQFGMHENRAFYKRCRHIQRNGGLYTADRNMNDNIGATSTRQNPNGNRNGLECPEERDYFPWWHPNPWIDMAVLVSDAQYCDYYQAESHNVKDTWYCEMTTQQRNNIRSNQNGQPSGIPVTRSLCTQYGGSWTSQASWKSQNLAEGPPVCQLAPYVRQNHLGNGINVESNDAENLNGEASIFDWTIPELPEGMNSRLCTVRLRYNISTNDYPAMRGMGTSEEDKKGPFGASNNCNGNIQENDNAGENAQDVDAAGAAADPDACNDRDDVLGARSLRNRPYVKMFQDSSQGSGTPRLSVALNTNQAGRTFQDRSYVFRVVSKPTTSSCNTIYNLNNRGRRGNIVQSYPSVEYDFVPNDLTVRQGDCIDIQFQGSDFNAARNPNNAEGWRYSDRMNMVEVANDNYNTGFRVEGQFEQGFFNKFGGSKSTSNGGVGTSADEIAKKFAFVGAIEGIQAAGSTCDHSIRDNTNNEDNDPRNCGKLNFANAHFHPGPQEVNSGTGRYAFTSTRNNNFSNRNQKGVITVLPRPLNLSAAEVVGIVFGAIAGFAVIAVVVAGLVFAFIRFGLPAIQARAASGGGQPSRKGPPKKKARRAPPPKATRF